MKSDVSHEDFTTTWYTAVVDSADPEIDRRIQQDIDSGSLTLDEVARLCALCVEVLIRRPMSRSSGAEEKGVPDSHSRRALAAQFAELAGSIDDSAAAALASRAARAAIRLMPDAPARVVLEPLARGTVDGRTLPSTTILHEAIRASIHARVLDVAIDARVAWPRTSGEFEALRNIESVGSLPAVVVRKTVRAAFLPSGAGDPDESGVGSPESPGWRATVSMAESWPKPVRPPDTGAVAPEIA